MLQERELERVGGNRQTSRFRGAAPRHPKRRFIAAALTRHHGNISKAAEEMGMYRQHLQLELAEYGIDASQFRHKG